jgi:hypothetical protein
MGRLHKLVSQGTSTQLTKNPVDKDVKIDFSPNVPPINSQKQAAPDVGAGPIPNLNEQSPKPKTEADKKPSV